MHQQMEEHHNINTNKPTSLNAEAKQSSDFEDVAR
jgi:hypothetical protein